MTNKCDWTCSIFGREDFNSKICASAESNKAGRKEFTNVYITYMSIEVALRNEKEKTDEAIDIVYEEKKRCVDVEASMPTRIIPLLVCQMSMLPLAEHETPKPPSVTSME